MSKTPKEDAFFADAPYPPDHPESLRRQLATERARADNAEADNEKLLTASNYEAERAAGFEKDARRYRWLLDKSWFQAAVRYYIAFNGSNLSDSDTAETIIDKAMKGEK